jgi:hypothetical protein
VAVAGSGAGVAVGGMAVAVGGTSVGGTAVGGTGVGGTAVGGTGVGGTGVGAGAHPASKTTIITITAAIWVYLGSQATFDFIFILFISLLCFGYFRNVSSSSACIALILAEALTVPVALIGLTWNVFQEGEFTINILWVGWIPALLK